jgi:tetratricopeptide (TPR) repeat protein
MHRRFALLALSCALLPACTKIQARDLIREGNVLYRNGQFEQAIERFDESLTLEPDGVTVLWNRACAAESIVLQLKDEGLTAEQRELRKKYADMALADFQRWLDNLPAPTEEDRKQVHDHRLAVLKADSRCDDLVAYWLEKHRSDPQDEGLYTVIARTYEETCNRKDKADEWYVQRTDDFPDSPKAWYALAVREFEPLFPDPESGLAYNDSLGADQRLAIADKVIEHLNRASEHDPKYRDPFVWRAMAYTQKQFSRVYDEAAVAPEDKLQAIFAREDSMLAWKESKAVCDIDEIPDCPIEVDVARLASEPDKLIGQRIFVHAVIVADTIEERSGAPDFKLAFEIEPPPRAKDRGKEGDPPPPPAPEGGAPARVKVEYSFLQPIVEEGEEAPDTGKRVQDVLEVWRAGGRKEFLTGTVDPSGVFRASEQPQVACCPLPPLTPEERAADAQRKRELMAEIEAAQAAAERKKGRKKKGKR